MSLNHLLDVVKSIDLYLKSSRTNSYAKYAQNYHLTLPTSGRKLHKILDSLISSIFRRASHNSNSQSSEEANVSESDTEGYHTPEHQALFTNMALSLYGIDKDVGDKLRFLRFFVVLLILTQGVITFFSDLIVKNEGYVITDESELKDATHAVVEAETAADSEKLERFKELFDFYCVFVKENWISDCVEARKKLDTMSYEM